MKLLSIIVLAVALTAGTASAAELIADGGDGVGIDVGEVTITNDATNLIVTITIDTGAWELVKSHVHVAEEVADIPQTGNGNAKPGKFDYCDQDPEADIVSSTEHVYTIPLADIGVDLGDPIVVAVHANIEYTDDNGTPGDPSDDILYEKSAWGEGDEISDGRDWAMYIGYTIPDPDLIVSDITLDSHYVAQGGVLGFTYTVANIGGEGPEGNSVFDVACFLYDFSVVTFLGGSYSAWSYHLDVGWSASRYENDVVITAEPGLYILIVFADVLPGLPPNYYPGVVESDETNNWAIEWFYVF